MKKTGILLSVLLLSIAVTVGVSVNSYHVSVKNHQYMTYLENQYQRILYDLANNVDNVEVSLSKTLVSNSTEQRGVLLGDVWNDAQSAQYKLNALPIKHNTILNTSKFLSQLSDYSYLLLKKNSAGIKPSEDELKTLLKLKDYSGYVRIRLREFVDDIGANGLELSELNSSESKDFKMQNVGFNDSMTKMSDQIQQYPTLLYDGPFSENVLNIKPEILHEKVVNTKEATSRVEKIIGKANVSAIHLQSSAVDSKIPVYSFLVERKGKNTSPINIDISRNGGKILYLLDTRNIVNETLDTKKAIKSGAEFLVENGFKKMVATYTLKYNNVLIVNYVKKHNGIMIYPDQIKLKIALDDGSIVGVESKQYLIANKLRNLPKPKISQKTAAKKVSTSLKIMNSRETLIPMESLREVLCYEFYGEYAGERYFVYINAMNGNEERILKVVNTENGELTM